MTEEDAMKKACILFVIAVTALAACTSVRKAETPKPVGKTAVLVIPAVEVHDTEYLEIRNALEKAGVKLIVAAPEAAPVAGMLGGTFTPDITFDAIDPRSADMIVCVGGNGNLAIWENATLHAKVREFAALGKKVGAICAASGILANAGVLEGIEATCYPWEPIVELLKSKGAVYTDRDVVVSGNIVTGNGPEASAAFGKQLAAML
jgi:protease I